MHYSYVIREKKNSGTQTRLSLLDQFGQVVLNESDNQLNKRGRAPLSLTSSFGYSYISKLASNDVTHQKQDEMCVLLE